MKDFLRDYQLCAVNKMRNGCILNGGVGSGKSRTGIFYYFKEQGGWIDDKRFIEMRSDAKDLYIITTAMKRDKFEFDKELIPFRLSIDSELNQPKVNVKIDSWNNIQKYADVQNAFFIFDEDKVTGKGAWVKTFLKIVKSNDWIILSATPGDTWEQYIPVFIANGFFKNRSEFLREHVVFSPFVTSFPKIDRYINTGKLQRLRSRILVDMDFDRPTTPHHDYIMCEYDKEQYEYVMTNLWDIYNDKPIPQASVLCYVLRRLVNSDISRQKALLELYEEHPKMIVFYNFDYEREILLNMYFGDDVDVAEWSGWAHQPVPTSDKWVYIVQYTAGCEGWNCITTDTIVFYSQNYSFRTLSQAAGRIDRMNTPYSNLYYYHLKSRANIDLAISAALTRKKKFNEQKFCYNLGLEDMACIQEKNKKNQ